MGSSAYVGGGKFYKKLAQDIDDVLMANDFCSWENASPGRLRRISMTQTKTGSRLI